MADVIHRIGIRAPITTVHDAVATAGGVARWWTRDAAPTADGQGVDVRFRRPDGAEVGRTTYALTTRAPAREVHWRMLDGPPEWVGTDVTFELREAADMTILVFGHRNWREPVEFMAHCSTKWATSLLSLEQLAETGAGRPAPDDVKIDDWN